jgi:hypothetical protein
MLAPVMPMSGSSTGGGAATPVRSGGGMMGSGGMGMGMGMGMNEFCWTSRKQGLNAMSLRTSVNRFAVGLPPRAFARPE